MSKIYKHQSIGNLVVIVEQSLESAKNIIRELLDEMGLTNEELNVEEVNKPLILENNYQ
jgi:hypothetical protein